MHGRLGHLAPAEVNPSDIVDIVERSGETSLHVARLVLIAIKEVFAHGVARHVVEGNPCAHIKAKAIIGAPPSRRTRIMLTDAELIAMLAKCAAKTSRPRRRWACGINESECRSRSPA